MLIIKNIKIILIFLVFTLMSFLCFYVLNLKYINENLSLELELKSKELGQVREELELNFQALEEREKESQRLNEEKNALNAELEKYYETDKQARSWADTLCPNGVIERLRR